jgi:hypothetical protein
MADFGADVAGVRRLLPTISIEASSEPSEGDVQAWLAEFTGNVARRLGDLTALDEAKVEELTVAARGLVHLAVAATTYDAHFPERAGLADESYGGVLWDRYTTGLNELDTEVTELRTAPENVTAGASPLYSFPEPAFPDNLDTVL